MTAEEAEGVIIENFLNQTFKTYGDRLAYEKNEKKDEGDGKSPQDGAAGA